MYSIHNLNLKYFKVGLGLLYTPVRIKKKLITIFLKVANGMQNGNIKVIQIKIVGLTNR